MIMSELEFEYIRYTNLKNIKRNFLQNCGLPTNEAIKVWANWIIVNRIQHKQIDGFLPTEKLELDNKTVSLLIEKGLEEETAINFYRDFIQQCHRWRYRYQYCKPNLKYESSQNDNRISLVFTEDEAIIDYRGVTHHIDSKIFDKLHRMLNRSIAETPDNHEERERSDGKFIIWKLLNAYALLDGLSYQWSLPPETFTLLKNSCKVETELFASPLNHHLDKYYSLFEIDYEFGSLGDFFKSTWEHFKSGGVYEANPPFIESIFIHTAQMMLNYLNNAVKEDVNLGFIFIMPGWLDSFAYKSLKSNQFYRTEVILRSGSHKYWEHRRNRLIQATFNTHVLILSSNFAYYNEFWSQKIEEEFIKSMSITSP